MLTIDTPAPTASYPSERAMNRPHWSYSQLSQYLRCPLQYYFERVLKLERQVIPSNMALGSAVHAALAEYHRHLQFNQPVPDRCVQQAFLNAWDHNEGRQSIQFRDGETRDDAIAQGVTLLEAYLQEPPPQGADKASYYVGWYDLDDKRHAESCGPGTATSATDEAWHLGNTSTRHGR
jgi:hypothetical protein